MKHILFYMTLVVLILLSNLQIIYACTISIPPLRKEFRTAKSVFAGKVLKIENSYLPTEGEKQDIPENWTEGSLKNLNVFSKVTFEIKNEWKGNQPDKKTFIAVSYWSCGCPGDQDKFEENEEYIIFAERKNFITVCDGWREKLDGKSRLTKRLDKFWFRTWASVFPF